MTRPEHSLHVRDMTITRDGQTRSALEWAKELNINRNTLRKRAERGLRGEDLIAPVQPVFGHERAARSAAKAKRIADAGA